MLGTFPDTFLKMATDTICHRFWVDFDSILGCFLVLKSENGFKKTQQKHTCKKVTRRIQGDPRRSGPGSYGPLKQFNDSQIPGLLNLIKALERIHWCLAARWRINKELMYFGTEY